jgi:hypothetical protein
LDFVAVSAVVAPMVAIGCCHATLVLPIGVRLVHQRITGRDEVDDPTKPNAPKQDSTDKMAERRRKATFHHLRQTRNKQAQHNSSSFFVFTFHWIPTGGLLPA